MEIQDSKFKVQSLKIRLHILSPIHIGCDDVYEPVSFVIDEKKRKLIAFDPFDFVTGLSEKQRAEFTKVCSDENILAIMKFIKNNSMKITGREVDIASGLIEHYKKILQLPTFDKKQVINQFEINRTAYNPQTNQPYIPGSSLKGSMRTAYLNALAKEKGITKWRDTSDKLETKLLNRAEGRERMSSDPFRMVKVSDLLPAGEVKTKIVYAVNKKKKKAERPTLAERGGVYQIFETIQPGSVFEGILNIWQPENGSGIKEPINIERLKSSLHKFYVPLLEGEIKTLKNIDIPVPLINTINGQFKGRIGTTAFVISLGRHSGAEAVTIEGNRYIRIMKGKDREGKMRYEYLDHSTTIWLASDRPKPANNNGLLPFGWAVIEVMDGL